MTHGYASDEEWGSCYGYDGRFYRVEEFWGDKPAHGTYDFPTTHEAVKFFLRRKCTFRIELVKGVWTLVAYEVQPDIHGRVREYRYLFGNYEMYKEALARFNIKPEIVEPEPKTPQEKIRKYAELGYDFQLRRRWNKYYLYALKWDQRKKKRDHKYIGLWNQELKKTAEELAINMIIYES